MTWGARVAVLGNRMQALRSVASGALARMAVLPISAILGIVVTRLIIEEYGQGAYAQYMLLVGLAALIPFADLGISAAIINAVAGAEDPREDENLRRVLVTCFRILAGSALTCIAIALLLGSAGLWPVLLGSGLQPETGPTAATLCLMAFGFGLLVAFSQQILIGLRLNHLSILIGGLQTPIVLLALLIIIKLELPWGGYIAVLSYLATFVLAVMKLRAANRRVRPILGQALRLALRVRTQRGGRVLDTAWPLLVQVIALPLAMQSGRLMLSHVADISELAEYSLGFQIFNPVWAVTVAAGMALWPIYAKARAQQKKEVSPLKLSVLFAGLAAVACLVLALLSDVLSRLATGGQIELSDSLVALFVVLMVIQAAKAPLGMYMTDAHGLRFQAYMVLAMLPVIVGLSWWFSGRWGAVGPVAASAIGVLIFQLLANWLYVHRKLAIREDAA